MLDVVIELFTEGHLDPGPDDVARRAGLSSRSVYRYFEDRDALLRAAIDRQQERVLPLYLIHGIGQGDLEGRIERFVRARMQLYEAIAATARASRARALVNPMLREQVRDTRRRLGEQVDKHFAPELDRLLDPRRRATSGAVDTLCQLEALDHLRVHLGLSAPQTGELLSSSLHALLASP